MKGGTVSPFDQRRGSAFWRGELKSRVPDHPDGPILEKARIDARSAWSRNKREWHEESCDSMDYLYPEPIFEFGDIFIRYGSG